MIRLVFLAVSILLMSCDARRTIADEVMEDMRLGEIRYLQGIGGQTLHDPKFRMTDRVMESVLAESKQAWVEEKKFDWQPRFFQIPGGISGYEFVKASEGSTELWRLDSVGNVSKQIYPEARYHYRVETVSGTSRVQVVLIEEWGDWRVGGIFQEAM